MADLNPWYMNYPLANLKTDPTVKEDYAKLVEKYRADKSFELTDEELKKFEVTAKRWESNQGYREIVNKMGDAKKHYTWARKQGYNLDNPRSEKEVALAKAVDDEMTDVRETTELYGRNKEVLDGFIKEIRKQQGLEEHEQTMDVDKSMNELRSIVFGKGSVREKNEALFNYSTTAKAKPVDLQKAYSEKLKEVTTGTEGWQNVTFDPETGITTTTGVKGMTQESLDKANEKAIKGFPEHELKQYKTKWEEDKEEGKGKKSFKDWMKRYLPVSLLQTTDKETQKGTKAGTGPAVDAQGDVIWTTPITDMKDPVYGENAVGFQSTGSLNLNNLFPKPTSYINLPITSSTVNTSTGETEEGFVGENLPSIPISANFRSVATEDIKIDEGAIKGALGVRGLLEQMGIPEKRKYFIIPKGEKISAEKKKIIDAINDKKGRMVYNYEDKPFLLKRTQFRQVEISDEYDIKSFGRTNEVPYFDVKGSLITLPGFKVYDEAIMKMYNELNVEGYNSILGGSPDKKF